MNLWNSAEVETATLGKSSAPFAVDGLSIDTRSLRPGDLFIALKGDNRDGHEFVAAAFAAKAGAALVSRVPKGEGENGALLTVADTQRGIEDLARAARARANARILAITGSVGKTTTKEMLRHCCDALGLTHASAASYNNHWGVPLSLAGLPRAAEYGVFEIGMNHAGEIRSLVGMVRPHAAIITAIAPAHMEFFGSCEAIADAKSEIFEGVVPGGAALIPADSPYVERLAARAAQAHIGTLARFGVAAGSEARLLSWELSGEGMRLKADIFGHAVDCMVGAPGAHIAANAVGALGLIALVGGDVLNAAAALKGFLALKGRGARFHVSGVEVIDESYNANPDSMAAALALLAIGGGRRIAVLGDMLEMGEASAAYHAGLAARIAAANVAIVFAVGPQMKALWEVLPAARRGFYAPTSIEIVGPLLAALRPGDSVLVKGSFGSKMAVVIDALNVGGI